MNQRWLNKKHSFRPLEVINTRAYEVGPLRETAAKEFVQRHHYSGTYPAARFRFGMFTQGRLVGVAVFSHPCNDRVLTNVFDGKAAESVELGRFVLLDEVPGNGETWFLGRCFRALRKEGLRGVLSFSDPVPRRTRSGELVFPGHIGTIYQAHNAAYLGRSRKTRLLLLPNGSCLNRRSLQKILAKEHGWKYAARILEDFGADAPGEDTREWVRYWAPKLTRSVSHGGNHKYAWYFNNGKLTSLPYPKEKDFEPANQRKVC